MGRTAVLVVTIALAPAWLLAQDPPPPLPPPPGQGGGPGRGPPGKGGERGPPGQGDQGGERGPPGQGGGRGDRGDQGGGGAGGDRDGPGGGGSFTPVDEAQVQAAIERGVTWLLARQAADGSWDEGYKAQFPIGPTALAALALIKAGKGDDPAVDRAFAYLQRAPITKTYDAGLLLMALEARYAPGRAALAESDKPYKTIVRSGWRRAAAADKSRAAEAAQWLLRSRHRPLWGYPQVPPTDGTTTRPGSSEGTRTGPQGGGGPGGPPGGPPGGGPPGGGPPGGGRGPPGGGRGPGGGGPGGGGSGGGGPGGGPGGSQGGGAPRSSNEWDHSNTQYALLGLGAAARLGVNVAQDALFEALDQLLAGQETSGPSVTPFAVPAADATFKEIDALAADLATLGAKARKGQPDDRVTRTRTFYASHAPRTMNARGWAYLPVESSARGQNDHDAARHTDSFQANVSMTAACVASLLVLKSQLEGKGAWEKRYRERVDQALRDGAAYLAQHFTVQDRRHPYYYLYGLERVGIMTGCAELGGSDWFAHGAAALVAWQGRDGSWGQGSTFSGGDATNAMPSTCFAVLFLARGSVPLVPELPERPRTGIGAGR